MAGIMAGAPKKVAVLGSTGSIGCNTLAVAHHLPQIELWGISGNGNLDLLDKQAQQYSPTHVVATDSALAANFEFSTFTESRLQTGDEALIRMACDPEVDIVVAAIVGQAGLASALAAARTGKRLCLANKESLVVAGNLLMGAARQSGTEVLPIDSEHSAIWQALQSGQRSEVKRVVLTASGGPFRSLSREELLNVSVNQALIHPNWQMGKKITIDSATLVNKALEIIEAHWLFGLEPDQIQVVIHPQSIIHSLVEFQDGSVIAQLSPPDMRLPIQYALTYPDRFPGCSPRLDWSAVYSLEMSPPNAIQQAALDLGYHVCEKRGTSGAVLNAANEVAVAAFLENKVSFADIVPSCREVLERHTIISSPTYDQLLLADQWAREEMHKWILA